MFNERPRPGSVVTITTDHPNPVLWDSNPRRIRQLRGLVAESMPWMKPSDFAVRTGNPGFPLAVIDLNSVTAIHYHSGSGMPVEIVESGDFEIIGSQGTRYYVKRKGSEWTCTCSGFGFRRSCRHITEVLRGAAEKKSKKATVGLTAQSNRAIIKKWGNSPKKLTGDKKIMKTEKKFTVAGTSVMENGQVKVRFANDLASRIKILDRGKNTEIALIELPNAMSKQDAVAWLKANPFPGLDTDAVAVKHDEYTAEAETAARRAAVKTGADKPAKPAKPAKTAKTAKTAKSTAATKPSSTVKSTEVDETAVAAAVTAIEAEA